MITISNQIRDLEPDSWYNFKPESMNISFDLSKPYGVDEENSYIFNAVTSNYFIPKWNRPVSNFMAIDENYTSNQLAESEFLVENDSSLMSGRNNSKMGGVLYREHTDAIESVDDVLAKINSNEVREYLFQFRGSTDSKRPSYLLMDYNNNNESFVPIVYDSKLQDKSIPVTSLYTNTKGTYEIWEANFAPEFIPNDGFGNPQDIRDLTFKLVNPVTGASVGGGERTYSFVRNGSLTSFNSEEVSNIYVDKNIYEMPEYNPGANNRFTLEDVYVFFNGRYYRMKTSEGVKLSIPLVSKVYFKVRTPYLFENRSYEISEQTVTTGVDDLFMEYLGFKFYYNSESRTIRLYDSIVNQALSYNFSSPENSTTLFYIKTSYEKYADHNPATGFFHYKLVYNIQKVGTTESTNYFREYKGGLSEIMYKGTEKITSIPSFDSYPHLIGQMPETTYARTATGSINKTITCTIDTDGRVLDINVPNKIAYDAPRTIHAVDNFALFINKNIQPIIYKLYITQYREDDSILDKSLIQYWPCDSLRPEDLRTTVNTVGTGSTSIIYDVYGYMKFSGPGKVTVNPVFHNVVKGSIYFDGNVTGNSNLLSSWSNNRNYTINFWFKSNQKTRGVILCDMDKSTVSTAGVYIGVSNSGTLEVGFDASLSRIYSRNITDNEWHMITIVCSSTSLYTVYVDGDLIDEVSTTSGVMNKTYDKNYQIYFMGHPLGNNVKGSLSRVAFYGTRITSDRLLEMYKGDIEHRIYGTVLASNMPFETEVRFFNFRSGEYINSSYSSPETGKFVYRNYDGMSVHLLVVNNNHQYGTIQVLGPLYPASVEQ